MQEKKNKNNKKREQGQSRIYQTEDNDQYRQGYIEGLAQARKEKPKTESNNAQRI